jgi:hypothetical protein
MDQKGSCPQMAQISADVQGEMLSSLVVGSIRIYFSGSSSANHLRHLRTILTTTCGRDSGRVECSKLRGAFLQVFLAT